VRGVATLLVAAALAGCGSGPSDEQQVRQTITDFARATARKDYRTLCQHVLAPKLIEQVKQIGLPCEQALQRGRGDVKDPRVIVGRVTVKGDTASAEVRSSAAGEAPSQDTVELTKVAGHWRISSLAKP
jgi:ketosteroid isomerase-like protein